MNFLVALCAGFLAGQAIMLGIMMEHYKVACWQSRIGLFCGVVIVASVLSTIL